MTPNPARIPIAIATRLRFRRGSGSVSGLAPRWPDFELGGRDSMIPKFTPNSRAFCGRSDGFFFNQAATASSTTLGIRLAIRSSSRRCVIGMGST